MPRRTNSLPKYRKHKASKLEYDRLIAESLQHGRQTQPGPQTGELTVVELVVAYVHYASGYYRRDGKPTTEAESIRLSLTPAQAMYGRQPCGEFGPD